MMHEDLLALAKRAAEERARPLESNFPVGAVFHLSNDQLVAGVNYEDRGKTPTGACAERVALQAANSQFGPLSDRGQDSRVSWLTAALWARTPVPITPCGICRDALAGSAGPEAVIVSHGVGDGRFSATIEELFPLAGRGAGGDVTGEMERWRDRGGRITEALTQGGQHILDQARLAADRSYLPPFANDPAAGAALELDDGTVVQGWVTMEATTRLGGAPIANAVRRMLEGPCSSLPQVLRVALFTNAEILRAPNGYDLQLLQEVAAQETPIIFGCLPGKAFATSLADLLPNAFGRRDLGY